MSFWIPSSIQKRLLRFALSRLELLDTDSLDLDRLDIAWGRRSTVELRDVGLHVAKLSALLHLPDRIHISTARILRLRVTVPADIYASGIVVAVDGVEVRVKIADVQAKVGVDNKAAAQARQSARSSRPNRDADEEDHLPTTQDITQSFLAEEPDEERRELEQAILSQSAGYPKDVDTSSEASEEELEPGVGVGLALPGFLAGFLKGVADRLEVSIKNVSFILDTSLVGTDLDVPGLPEHALQTSTRLNICSVDVDGLTSGNGVADNLLRAKRTDKRGVHLRDLSVRLVTDPMLFASLERMPGPHSPSASRSQSSPQSSRTSPPSERGEKRPAPDLTSPSTQRGSRIIPSPPITESPVLGLSIHESQILETSNHESHFETESVHGLGLLAASDLIQTRDSGFEANQSPMTQDVDRFADASDEEDDVFFGSGRQSRTLQSSITSSHRPSNNAGRGRSKHGHPDEIYEDSDVSDFPDSPTESMLFSTSPEDHQSFGKYATARRVLENHAATAPQSLYNSRSEARTKQNIEPVSRSQPIAALRPVGTLTSKTTVPLASSPGALSNGSSSGSSMSEDLAQSKVFSHEDAESMYLSAMSEVSATSSQVRDSSNPHEDLADMGHRHEALAPPATTAHSSEVTEDLTSEDERTTVTPRASSPVETREHSPPQFSNSRNPPPIGIRTPERRRSLSSDSGIVDSKTFFSIDQTSLWTPWASSAVEVPSEDDGLAYGHNDRYSASQPERSVHHTSMPGAFSQYVEASTHQRRRPSSPHPRGISKTQLKTSGQDRKRANEDAEGVSDVEFEIGNIQGSVDISTLRLLYHIFTIVTTALASDDLVKKEADSQTNQISGSDSKVSFKLDTFLLSLLERLPGSTSAADSPVSSYRRPALNEPNVVAQLKLRNIGGLLTRHDDLTTAKVDIAQFTFGFPDEHVISFDSEASMRTSIRDLDKPKTTDISLNYRSDDERGPEVHIDTLPVIVSIKMQKLDERLSCFGGLSGVLDLSSSIASTSTVMAPVPAAVAKPAGKAVRFSSTKELESPATLSPLKLNARVSGVLFFLQGKACGTSLHCSALKVAVREDYAGLQIDKIKFAGPFINDARSDAPLVCDVENCKIRFQTMPNEDDLDNFVSIITPSKDKYEDDDDIILDTLLRQRKKGSIIKVNLALLQIKVHDINGLQRFQLLGDEIAKLSSVAKYLPEDDRPGILSFVTVDKASLRASVNDSFGLIFFDMYSARLAHVGLPALLAVELGEILLRRSPEEELIGPVLQLQGSDHLPMVMIRQIGDELEPTIKVKLFNMGLEYRVPTLMAALGLKEDTTTEEMALSMASSIATLRDGPTPALARQASDSTEASSTPPRPMHVDLLLRDCALGLNPHQQPSRGLVLLSDARLTANISAKEDLNLSVEVRKASLLAIDDVENLDLTVAPADRASVSQLTSPAPVDLARQGYRPLGSLSSASVTLTATKGSEDNKLLNVVVSNELLIMETCADSTQTLIAILNGLSPPMPSTASNAYRTQVMPIEDMMKSFTGEAFENPDRSFEDEDLSMDDADQITEDLPTDLSFMGSLYLPEGDLDLDEGDAVFDEEIEDDIVASRISRRSVTSSIAKSKVPATFATMEERFEYDPDDSPIQLIEDYLKTFTMKKAIRNWDSKAAKYGVMYHSDIKEAPLKVDFTMGTFIWNLYDGYDWAKTRDAISKAVEDVQTRAEEKRKQRLASPQDNDDPESEIGDFLFQSIWIAVPPNRDAKDLRRQINHEMDDLASETGTITSAAESRTTSRPAMGRRKSRSLKLERSRRHKISIELRGVTADVLVTPPDIGETQSSINLRVRDFEIFDHVPASTWKKFATYMHDAGERELDKPQIHAEILNVRPVPTLPASEMVVRVKVLPVRLHIDQDALDFITRFFEFKDDGGSADGNARPKAPPSNAGPFLQRLEIHDVKVKMDYKPKRIDYAGLRSGHTSEFMNFVTLDGASFTLRHVILYGVAGPDRLHKMLNDIWMPDVKFNQLPGVVAGLSVVRPLVDVGAGVRDLVVVPMREYKKDGRIVRSIRKGAVAFAKTTSSELARLGAKVAIGTQNVLEGAEGYLSPQTGAGGMAGGSGGSTVGGGRRSSNDWDEDFGPPSSPYDDSHARAVSHYADQPLNVVTGMRTALRNLERDLMTTRDAVIAIGGEIRDSESAAGVAGAVARHAPTVILRPLIGSTRAVGTALMGVGNAVDGRSKRRVEDKYKRY